MLPSTWCEVNSKSLSGYGLPRKLESLMRCCQAFKKPGSDLKKAKMFGNIVLKLIICGPTNSLILELISPIELDLLLGAVNPFVQSKAKDV